MQNNMPRLLLVSEATLDEQATGLNRTLFNLFLDYPSDRFMLCAPEVKLRQHFPVHHFSKQVVAYPQKFSVSWKNRLEVWLLPLLTFLNFLWMDCAPVPCIAEIQDFDPEIVLICPDTPAALLMGYKIVQSLDCPFLVYLMDDWVATSREQWLSGSTQSCCRKLLTQAAGWLVISEQLEKSLIERYGITPRRSLVVHNPVDLADKAPPDFAPHQRATFQVAYAGSIWTMHYDAVAVIAQAIAELKTEGHDIELILYTQEGFWSSYQEDWQQWDVKYGGLVPYEKLQSYLQEADLLLVASSFLAQYANITRSSVQTKLTDYMMTGRPILSCGPEGGACNDFIEKWRCGLICATNEVPEIKKILGNQLLGRTLHPVMAEKAFQVVAEQFEKGRVTEKTYQFIQDSTTRD
jgi:glycosyltransferase involved in cell wall biosynthesis